MNIQVQHTFPHHPYHIVQNSPWPIFTANSVFSILVSIVIWFHGISLGWFFCLTGLIATIFSCILWWRDVVIEAKDLGQHTTAVQSGISIGVSLFIVTEVFFFFSIFWAYLHSSLSPSVELGYWPPLGIDSVNPITVPLLNTILLVSSGAFITYAHHAIFKGGRVDSINGTLVTIILAIIFTALQVFEYQTTGFTIADSAYGSAFYFGTGTHGLHVLLGTIFIIVGAVRICLYHFTKVHHLGYESSILYWHFVDVVWIALYIIFYFWGA